VVKGPSSSGKSYLVGTVLRAFPEKAYLDFTSMSEHALPPPDDLSHENTRVHSLCKGAKVGAPRMARFSSKSTSGRIQTTSTARIYVWIPSRKACKGATPEEGPSPEPDARAPALSKLEALVLDALEAIGQPAGYPTVANSVNSEREFPISAEIEFPRSGVRFFGSDLLARQRAR